MNPYIYKELSEERPEIRLISSTAAINDSGHLEISLSTYPLEEAPPYIALSYVCGDQNVREPITIDGLSSTITSNLDKALRRIVSTGYNHGRVCFWADAVCIDQNSPDEKTQQIRMLDRIFGKAKIVIAWLGDASDDGDLAVDMLKFWSAASISSTFDNINNLLDENPTTFTPEAWNAVEKFFKRSWWRRMWTYQEYVLSSLLIFYCGDKAVSPKEIKNALQTWDVLKRNMGSLNIDSTQRLAFMSIDADVFQIMHFHRNAFHNKDEYRRCFKDRSHFTMQALQEHLHDREVTDDRDKLFAILAVADESHVLLEPDYRKSSRDIYMEYAIQSVKLKGTLETLSISGVGVLCDDQHLPLDLPSWVPDLRQCSRWPLNLTHSKSSTVGLDQSVQICLAERMLSILGVECDIVTRSLPKTRPFEYTWASLMQKVTICHPTKISQVQIFFRTLYQDFSDSRRPDEFENEDARVNFFNMAAAFMFLVGLYTCEKLAETPRGQEKLQQLRSMLDQRPHLVAYFAIWLSEIQYISLPSSNEAILELFTGTSETKDHLQFPKAHLAHDFNDKLGPYGTVFMRSYAVTTRSRSFFMTKTGYLGLGPEGMQEGDRLCLLFGGQTPFLLRKIQDRYVNVGQCYVYGMMCGELVDDIKARKYDTQTFEIL